MKFLLVVHYICDDGDFYERIPFDSAEAAEKKARDIRISWICNRSITANGDYAGDMDTVFDEPNDIYIVAPGWNDEGLHVKIFNIK